MSESLSFDAARKVRYYQQLLQLAAESTQLYPADLPVLARLADRHAPWRHNASFRTCKISGRVYRFSKSQSAVVAVLWDAHAQGCPWEDQRTVLERAGLEATKLSAVFRGHPAVGEWIRVNDLGAVGLVDPDDGQDPREARFSQHKPQAKIK